MKKKKPIRYGAAILTAAAAIFLILWFFTAIYNIRDRQSGEGLQQLETALHRAAVACYAAEGVYPPTLEYLTTHYGIQIDESRYQVFYEIFADNLMPDITVLEKNHEK